MDRERFKIQAEHEKSQTQPLPDLEIDLLPPQAPAAGGLLENLELGD